MSRVLNCSQCRRLIHEQINNQTTFWTLQCCAQKLCSVCFTSFAFQVQKHCPLCNIVPEEIEHCFFERHGRGKQAKLYRKTESNSIIHHSDKEYIILLKTGNIPMTLCLDTNEDFETNEENVQKITSIFNRLHKVLIPTRKIEYKNDVDDGIGCKGSFQERLDNLVTENKSSPLFKCIENLAIGDKSVPKNQQCNFQRSIFLATQNIQHSKDTRGVKFRHIMTDAQAILGEEDRFDILNRFGVSYSKNTRRKINDEVVARAKKNARENLSKVSQHSYVITSFDNIGYKNRQGSKEGEGQGYVQFTGMKHIIINEEILRKMKIYALEGDDYIPLSRESNDWSIERAKDEGVGLYEKLLKPNEDDINQFGEVVLDICYNILKGVAEGVFPSLIETKRILSLYASSNQKRSPNRWNCPSFRGRISDSSIDDHDPSECARAQVIYDVPLKKDLSKNETVKDIMTYKINSDKFIMENGSLNPLYRDITPIMKDIPAGLGSDGGPAIAAQNEMRSNLGFNGKCHASFGGFHTMVELRKKRGALFEHTHLRGLTSLFRQSSKSQDWVLQPSDPGQAEDEYIQMSIGIYVSAIRQLFYIKKNKLDIEKEFDKDFLDNDEESSASTSDSSYRDDESVSSDESFYGDEPFYGDELGVANDELSNYFGSSVSTESSIGVCVHNLGDNFDRIALDDPHVNIEEANNEEMSCDDNETSSEDSENDETFDNNNVSSEYDNSEEEEEEVSITPSEVVDFMIKRAERNPQAFVVLLELRFHEVILMLLRAESNANAPLYFTALKLSMILFVNTNANKYVEMICNFTINRDCMSDAERAIHDEFMIFLKTKNLKSCFLDRLMEWDNRSVRVYTGKYYDKSTEKKQKYVFLTLNEIRDKKGLSQVNNNEAKKSKRDYVKIDRPFFESYAYCEDINLWLGKPMCVPTKPYAKRKDTEIHELVGCSKVLYALGEKNNKLFKDVLSTVSRGLSRSKHYFEKFHVYGNLTDTKRPVAERDLQQVQVTDAKLKLELDWIVCLDSIKMEKEAKSLYTIARIQQELSLMNDTLMDLELEPITSPRGTKKRIYWINLLMEARTRFKLAKPLEWEHILKANIAQRFISSQDSASDIAKRELQNSFFTFKDSHALSTIGREEVNFNRTRTETHGNNEFGFDEEIDNLIDDMMLNINLAI